MFDALAVLRVVVLLNALALAILHSHDLHRPGLAVGCLVVMVGWTAFATWAYAAPARRTRVLLVADLALALALLAATPLVKGATFTSSLPGFWIIGALFAWAIHYRHIGGLVAGGVLAATDLVQRHQLAQSDYGDAFLLVIGGVIVGFMCGSLQQMATERDEAQRAAAMAAERARLARAVHDGVLQVLALVQRHGQEHGGDAGELARLAAEQETELRRLIRAVAHADAHAGAAGPTSSGSLDLVTELARLEGHGVTVATPAFPVPLAASTVRELVDATRECLENVRRHAGAGAQAFVLLQSFPDRIELSVRDDGPGIAPGRLEEAAAAGRLGIPESIRGRIAALGGTADLMTGPVGTEWEFVVPRVRVEVAS